MQEAPAVNGGGTKRSRRKRTTEVRAKQHRRFDDDQSLNILLEGFHEEQSSEILELQEGQIAVCEEITFEEISQRFGIIYDENTGGPLDLMKVY